MTRILGPKNARTPQAGVDADGSRLRVLALLRKYGRDTTSFQTLGHEYRYLFVGDEACVGYVDTGGAWVSACAPFAPSDRIAEVEEAFAREAQAHRRRAVLFAIEAPAAASTFDSLLIGEQPIWDPRAWDETVRHVSSLREQIRRAKAKGVRVVRLAPSELAADSKPRVAIERLIARWQRTKQMAPMRFLVTISPFTFREERRHYAAYRGDQLVGFLALAPIYARRGYLFENLLRDPSAPNGTTERLFDAAMRDLATEGVDHATLGLAPLAGVTDPWLQRARSWGRTLYDFDGLHAFKRKLRPLRFAPVYVAYPRGRGLVAIADLLVAFAGGSLVRFGVASLVRGPEIVLRALTLVLWPWTLALALAPASPWFPSEWVQAAWIGFDLALGVALLSLRSRWRRRLATCVAVAVTIDASVTLLEALAWNLPHMRSAWESLPIAIAVVAPMLAAAVMWGARARLSWREPFPGATEAPR